LIKTKYGNSVANPTLLLLVNISEKIYSVSMHPQQWQHANISLPHWFDENKIGTGESYYTPMQYSAVIWSHSAGGLSERGQSKGGI